MSGASLGLRNEGDLIHLQYGRHTIDSVYYDPSWHQAGVRDATGLSLERLLPEGPSNDPASWTSSPDPSGGTPGRPNAARLQTTPPLPEQPDLEVTPSPFSPDGDGIDDVTVIRFRLPTAGAWYAPVSSTVRDGWCARWGRSTAARRACCSGTATTIRVARSPSGSTSYCWKPWMLAAAACWLAEHRWCWHARFAECGTATSALRSQNRSGNHSKAFGDP